MQQPVLFIILIEVMLVSLVLIGALLFVLAKKNRHIRQLEQTDNPALPQPVNYLVSDFFRREKTASRQHRRNAQTSSQQRTWLLREKYCDAELQSLAENGLSPSNYTRLVTLLAGIFEQDKPRKNPAAHDVEATNTSLENAGKRLNELENLLIERNRTIIELNKKLNDHYSASKNDEEKAIALRHENDKQTFIKLRKELHAAKDVHNALNSHFTRLYHSSQFPVDAGTAENHREQEVKELRTSLDSMQKTYNSALEEIIRLQQGNSEKRKIILRLEAQYQKQSVQDPESEALIKKLKTQLRDSELCTAVLESETDSLRERIRELSEHSEKTDFAFIPDIMPTSSQLGEFGRHLLDSLNRLSAANTESEIANILLTLANQLNINIAFRLSFGERLIWQSNTNEPVGTEIKTLLQSLKPSNDESWLDTNLGVVISLRHCQAILLKTKKDRSPVDLQRLAKAFSVANSAIKRVEQQTRINAQRKNLMQIIDKTCRQLQNMESQHKNIILQTQESLDTLAAETRDFTSTLNLSQNQQKFLDEIIGDHSTRLSINLQTSRIIDRTYISLINSLSDCQKGN